MHTQESKAHNRESGTVGRYREFWKITYSAGVALAICTVILTWLTKKPSYFNVGATICITVFVAGFCGTTYPKVRSFWEHKVGTWFRRAFHALLFFIAFVPARTLVSEVMGLPGQDFDATVAILSLCIYPALWFFVVALICSGIGLIHLFIFLAIRLTMLPVVDDMVRFMGTVIKNERLRHFIFTERTINSYFSLAQWGGATATALLLGQCFDKAGAEIANNDQIIKSIAYYTDYQIAGNYPGIIKHLRYRLHENGVVSYAIKSNSRITILIDKVKDS
ncbi:hypothetical protein [Pseudomonas mandelii]|uniref:Uncharacterized protein n=1 Tax=Pseudomonas mandelii TaxID=75612 RepID=A0A502HL16_9PSED|nr:hypothetical protein [Pseudomonas mandelii]TPG75497.1 hypothetical protein EAH74_30675 [Pseudomonas mandelii]